MPTNDILGKIAQTLRGEQVYGPVTTVDGITMIPAAVVRGGGGGGGGTDGEQSGDGGGFGLEARPVGAFIIDANGVRWKPVIDVGRMILGCQVLVLAWFWLRRRSRQA